MCYIDNCNFVPSNMERAYIGLDCYPIPFSFILNKILFKLKQFNIKSLVNCSRIHERVYMSRRQIYDFGVFSFQLQLHFRTKILTKVTPVIFLNTSVHKMPKSPHIGIRAGLARILIAIFVNFAHENDNLCNKKDGYQPPALCPWI